MKNVSKFYVIFFWIFLFDYFIIKRFVKFEFESFFGEIKMFYVLFENYCVCVVGFLGEEILKVVFYSVNGI